MGLFRRKKPDQPAAVPPAAPSPLPRVAADPPAAAAPAPAAATNAAAAAQPAAPATATAAGGPATVTLVDGFGRPLAIPREQFKKEVLPQVVEAYLHAPERLAAAILQYLREGLAVDLLPAALRLAAVDPDPERGLSILAAVQRESGDVDAALATLRELQQRRPDSAAARVGFAIVRDRQGDRSAATALLWEALQLDSNHPDAVAGWLSWERQRRGDADYAAVLAAACALPGAWRALLFRARLLIDRGDIEAAVRDHRDVLARAGEESDALWMIVDDLVRAARHDLVQELVLPRYRVDRHHPAIGIGLLRHHLATRQPGPGMALLHELRVRFQRALDNQLARFDAEFTQLAAPPLPATAATQKVSLYRIDKPLWYAVLGEPAFLLPRTDAVGALLAALAVQQPQPRAQVTREDELGRMSRSVPLFLAEQLWLAGKVPAAVALPVADAGGWVVAGAPWSEQRLVEQLTGDEQQRLRLVTGVVRADGTQRVIELWVHDCARGERIGAVQATGSEGKLGGMLLALLRDLSPLLGGPPALQPQVGSEAFWDRFATAQAQLAALVVAHSGAMPRDRVYGHRAILEWLLATALDERRSVQARLLLAAGLCADAAIGSLVHREMAAPFAELFRQEPAGSPFAQVALLPLRTLGLESMWQHRRDEIMAAGNDACRTWLQRIEAAPRS